MKYFFLSWGMVIVYVVFNSYGALILKAQILKAGEIPSESLYEAAKYLFYLIKIPYVISAIIAIFISATAWMVALSRMEISIAYPVAVGLNFVIVIIFGFLFFNETLNRYKILGIFLVFLSIFFFAKGD